jgi:hypothetical protein
MSLRFNSLDDDAKHVVRAAALIGPRTSRAWLVGATGFDDDRAPVAARAAVDAGVLLTGDGDGYGFRHALLRQAVLDDLVPDERIALHRAIAHALDDHSERAAGIDQVVELARHWDAAEESRPALRLLVAAARQADASYAFEAALGAYERALFWWDAVDDPSAGYAGYIDRAADLARAGLDEACALNPNRGVEAVGRVYPLMWTADRASELFEIGTRAAPCPRSCRRRRACRVPCQPRPLPAAPHDGGRDPRRGRANDGRKCGDQ